MAGDPTTAAPSGLTAESQSGLLWRPAPHGLRYATIGVLLAAFGLVLAQSYHIVFSGDADSFTVSEWLINYAGGFVRRGLGGATILWLATTTNESPRVVVFGILVACYALIFASVAIMTLRLRHATYLELLLAISPFATLFPVLHKVAGQRKEVLLLALAGIAGTTRAGRLDRPAKYAGWSLAFALLVAAHDGSIFFLPLFVIYLRVLAPPEHPMGYRAVLLLLPAACVFVSSWLFSARVDVGAICAAMDRAAKGNWCLSAAAETFPFAAAWLKASTLDGLRSVIVRYSAHSFTALPLTLLAGAAGLLPVVVALRKDTVLSAAVADLPMRRLFVWLSLFAVALVFAVGNDWNRWFYIVTSLLTLLHFAARANSRPAGRPPAGRYASLLHGHYTGAGAPPSVICTPDSCSPDRSKR